MIRIIFKDLEKSELAKDTVLECLNEVLEQFPDLQRGQTTITLSMQNSPTQAGPDVFGVKFHCRTGRYKGVILEKRADNLYKALADLSNNLLERLNRFGDKKRVKEIKKAREAKRNLLRNQESEESAS